MLKLGKVPLAVKEWSHDVKRYEAQEKVKEFEIQNVINEKEGINLNMKDQEKREAIE